MQPVVIDWPSIQAVVFDLDNTLVSSALDFAWLRQQIGCSPTVDLLEHANNQATLAESQRAMQVIIDHELDDARHSHLMPGAQQLILALAELKLHTAIVTRNCLEAAQIKLERHQLNIERLISREHFAPKPQPDALLALLDEWQLKPHQLLYVGDYIHDLNTAINAGTPSCLVNFHPQHQDFRRYASITVDNLQQLIPPLRQSR
ncbi:haloacid dehalogenase superfamily, subfamily IA, variant 3 with third motif having DD or ED/haloacid dehalogenase superfamily, subfamily IA, variant 1 with third motif having Dx(3-4)D or Dx(3-4)E [Vibrio xiamenensis]|uniref:Haloacid dehalogenase superfamily, subfamily IA, variant 3 with third motif having DD or ED/haloacid dehalogenase superfamily, subfamily IA, variant 1 with third motif having Dx(3-4)D or Dx(3-4)E n=1 Tax=Vibrio xiamenensis TaxID=861298 RepID=A0A1G7XKP7_9VIBR|nr:HAD-IA family hydrolase [Vibrio xiamenensis]SDG84779.1 haloacid dehalogenase superfamily, subfamily IA, variant 3 with third motif having DD or ED/haloacid dehalogenase superfamily, subfamily IA, variant 1 with third motif having Dx(3-4)D or Dx(3-4)E [Vibrio xiamenensis]